MAVTSRLRWMLGINSFLFGSLLTLGLLGLGLMVVVSGCMQEPTRKSEDIEQQPVYSRSEFSNLVLGKTESEVMDLMGKPVRTSTDSEATYWHYHKRTRDPVTGKPDTDVQLVFRNGAVETLGF